MPTMVELGSTINRVQPTVGLASISAEALLTWRSDGFAMVAHGADMVARVEYCRPWNDHVQRRVNTS